MVKGLLVGNASLIRPSAAARQVPSSIRSGICRFLFDDWWVEVLRQHGRCTSAPRTRSTRPVSSGRPQASAAIRRRAHGSGLQIGKLDIGGWVIAWDWTKAERR
jgi:hypothetical protein